jgi:hypothetical protein
MPRKVRVPISSARSRLFQLTEMVRAGDDTVVVLEQRGSTEHVALVREARLAYLEARAAEAEKREAKPFRLQGSMTSTLSDDELDDVLRDIRRGWNTPSPATPQAGNNRDGRRRR